MAHRAQAHRYFLLGISPRDGEKARSAQTLLFLHWFPLRNNIDPDRPELPPETCSSLTSSSWELVPATATGLGDEIIEDVPPQCEIVRITVTMIL